MNDKMWDNSNLQGNIQWDNQTLPGLSDDELFHTNWNLTWVKSNLTRQRISAAMRGKSLEQLIGQERAQQGRLRRSEAASHARPPEVVDRILATKKKKGTYEAATHGMRGKTHAESTREQQRLKAQIRQQIKRTLGLGRSDAVPPDLLAQAYHQAGLE